MELYLHSFGFVIHAAVICIIGIGWMHINELKATIKTFEHVESLLYYVVGYESAHSHFLQAPIFTPHTYAVITLFSLLIYGFQMSFHILSSKGSLKTRF